MLGEQASYTCLPAAWGANLGKTSGQESFWGLAVMKLPDALYSPCLLSLPDSKISSVNHTVGKPDSLRFYLRTYDETHNEYVRHMSILR